MRQALNRDEQTELLLQTQKRGLGDLGLSLIGKYLTDFGTMCDFVAQQQHLTNCHNLNIYAIKRRFVLIDIMQN